MDAPKQQTPPTAEPSRAKTWQAQSRIAGYIKGNVKLEEIVSREKLVRPEQRHNRRVFKALIDDDDEPAGGAVLKGCGGKNRSAISRCPSSSTKTSTSLSRVPPHQQLTADDLTRTIVEKNEHITALRDQLEALRSCARIEQLPEGGAERRSLRAVLERLLECLLDMLTNLRHADEHDERMAQFVAAVERERQNVLRSVDALCQANALKDEELRQMSGEQAQMRSRLQQLRHGNGGLSSEERSLHERNVDLVRRLRAYEQKYLEATEELRRLSTLAESVRKHIDAEKEAFDRRAAEHRKCVEDLRSSCHSVQAEAEKRLAQLVQDHASEVAQLRKEKDESTATVRRLEDEIRSVTSAEHQLREENAALKAQLNEVRQANMETGDEIKRLREEKEALETDLADKEASDADDFVRATVKNEKVMSFAKQDSQWHELKRILYASARRAGILPTDDVR